MHQKAGLVVEKSKPINLLAFTSAIKNVLLKLFGNLLNNLDVILASSFHPYFKLKGLYLLASISNEDVDSLQNRIKNKMISLTQSIKSKTFTISIPQTQNILKRRFLPKLLIKKTFLVKVFLKINRAKRAKNKFWKISFQKKALMAVQRWYLPIFSKIHTLALFVNCNAVMPLNAAIERSVSWERCIKTKTRETNRQTF